MRSELRPREHRRLGPSEPGILGIEATSTKNDNVLNTNWNDANEVAAAISEFDNQTTHVGRIDNAYNSDITDVSIMNSRPQGRLRPVSRLTCPAHNSQQIDQADDGALEGRRFLRCHYNFYGCLMMWDCR